MSPTATHPAKEGRLELRLSRSDKQTLEAAARQRGVTVSAYLLDRVLPEARRDAANTWELGPRDRDRFLDLLDHPPKPN
jgi:uncharacterized protein (DUF1778 family)